MFKFKSLKAPNLFQNHRLCKQHIYFPHFLCLIKFLIKRNLKRLFTKLSVTCTLDWLPNMYKLTLHMYEGKLENFSFNVIFFDFQHVQFHTIFVLLCLREKLNQFDLLHFFLMLRIVIFVSFTFSRCFSLYHSNWDCSFFFENRGYHRIIHF